MLRIKDKDGEREVKPLPAEPGTEKGPALGKAALIIKDAKGTRRIVSQPPETR